MTKYETECQARDCIYALKRKATAPLMKQRQDLMREVARLDLEIADLENRAKTLEGIAVRAIRRSTKKADPR